MSRPAVDDKSSVLSGMLYRIDTFHPSWELVRACLFSPCWLALFTVPDSGLEATEPFWSRKIDPLPLRRLPLRLAEKLQQKIPPENLINLSEVTINRLDDVSIYSTSTCRIVSLSCVHISPSSCTIYAHQTANLSPIGKLMAGHKRACVELLRINEGVPLR